MSSHRPDFRPDVEGLRGAAILLVVLFHAGVSGLAGGFVGVDVFFVLSGFFITRLLAAEFAATESIDVRAFWGRRALRLLPPFLVVFLATLALVWWLYAPIDRVDIADSARSVAMSSGNMEFARGAVNYFNSGDDPFLHTWSLAVEEQFYFVWPLLFLVLALAFERRRADSADPARVAYRGLLVGVAVVAGISFAAAVWLTHAAQPWAFFSMPTRMWEFALGGALALVMDGRVVATDARRAALLQGAGLLAIGVAVATYDRTTPYPGVAALLPALGAVAFLAGGWWSADNVVGRAVSAGWLRWLGRMSYGWYLWHWPLVGLGAVLYPGIGAWGKLAWSALALALAWLTYHLIERSASDGRLSRIPARWLSPAAFVATVGAALLAHAALVSARHRVAQPDQRAFAAARVDRMKHGCWANSAQAPKEPCAFGDTRSSTTVVLLGDSHAEHWLGALDRIGRERGWRIVAMVKGGCPVADTRGLVNGARARRDRECARYREAMVQRIVAMRPAAAILSSWDHYVPMGAPADEWQVPPDAWGEGLRRTYARLSAAGIRSVAIRGTPRTWFDVPSCLSRRAAHLPFATDCTYDRANSLNQAAYAAQTRAAQGLAVRFVDMNDQVCATARCPAVRNGVVVFTDDNHLTASFSRSAAPVLAVRVDAALRQLGVRLP